jgi:hypothetical protein
VDSLRRDVTVVTVPLLGADWYGRELSRRYDLLPKQGANGENGGSRSLPALIADRARQLGRPVAASVALDRHTRNQLAGDWTLSGLVYVAESSTSDSAGPRVARSTDVDTANTKVWAARIEKWLKGRTTRPSTDTMDDYALGLLSCPRLSLIANPDSVHVDSLATLCNRR